MNTSFRSYQPDQPFLLPPDPRDWLAEAHLAYFISVREKRYTRFFIHAYFAVSQRCQKAEIRSIDAFTGFQDYGSFANVFACLTYILPGFCWWAP